MPTPRLRKGLGRRVDPPDARDYLLKAQQAVPLHEIGAPLPSSTDVFTGLQLPVYDQGELGSCTANAGVLYRRFLAQRFAKYSAPDEDLSRLFLYYQERLLPWNNDVATDSGAAIRDIFYVLTHLGVCPEKDDPYQLAALEFASPLYNNNEKDLADSAQYKIGAYHRVPDVATARSCLVSGYAVALGFTVYESFEDIGSDGVMPMPGSGEQAIGGHATVIRGYTDSRASFLVQNSWGPSWGERGCFWMPYEYIERADLSEPDMWIGHLGAPWHAN